MPCVRATGHTKHTGARSLLRTTVAALFYSLTDSAKLNGVETAAYISEAICRAIESPGTVTVPNSVLNG